MVSLRVNGEVLTFRDWLEIHNNYVKRGDCNCHCQTCCEADPVECAEATLDQCYDWERLDTVT